MAVDRAAIPAWRRGLAGLNLRLEWTEVTVAIEYVIADGDRAQFGDDRRQSDYRSNFAYRSMCAAAALLASREGKPIQQIPSARSLEAVMDRVARVQLVKCNPNTEVVNRGAPSKAMCQRCPPRFLFEELKVLAPGSLVMFGQDAFDAVTGHGGVRWRRNRATSAAEPSNTTPAAPSFSGSRIRVDPTGVTATRRCFGASAIGPRASRPALDGTVPATSRWIGTP